jgi:large subunit ribosomal protein L4
MTIDVVNGKNEKVGSVELSDEVFTGRVNTGIIWESVVHQNAGERRGTHATKTRAQVSGTGKKPWRQKGTGRARVGEARNPLWRSGGIVFGPQPRDYAFRLPRKVTKGALRAALIEKLGAGAVTVVDELAVSEPRTKRAVELLADLNVTGKAVLVDVSPSADLELATRNLPGIRVVRSNQLTARDVVDAQRIVTSKAAVEHLAQVLGS